MHAGGLRASETTHKGEMGNIYGRAVKIASRGNLSWGKKDN